MSNIVEDDVIKAEMQDGLSQVDENLIIDEIENVYDKSGRKLSVFMKVIDRETEEVLEINNEIGG